MSSLCGPRDGTPSSTLTSSARQTCQPPALRAAAVPSSSTLTRTNRQPPSAASSSVKCSSSGPQLKARRCGGSQVRTTPVDPSEYGSPEKRTLPPARGSSSTAEGNQRTSSPGSVIAAHTRSTVWG